MAGQEIELLLKLPKGDKPAFAPTSKTNGLAAAGIDLEPLFETTSESAPGAELLAAGPERSREWYVARPTWASGARPWDAAHEAMDRLQRSPGIAQSRVPEMIEPDLVQQWDWEGQRPDRALAAASDACVFAEQVKSLPFRSGEFAWHLGDLFSQLRSAREQASNAAGHQSLIRIAHLDTGYDAEHFVFKDTHLDRDLQRNFVDEERLKDARDLGVDGLLKSPGHGTGTLSILAGGHFKFKKGGYSFDAVLGGAPEAHIVPVRVGNSVVQLSTKTVAKGINYAAELCASDNSRIHIISMSMGGVASAAWADAVNKAYNAGIIFVAAAGNNYSAGPFAFPTRHIVYPARFRRVIALCLALGEFSSFADDSPRVRPISKAGQVMAVYHNSLGRKVELEEPALILAIWPDGYAVWSSDQVHGGGPYLCGRINPEQVTAAFEKFRQDGLLFDKSLRKPHFGPDSSYQAVLIKSGNSQVEMSSWHELADEGRAVATASGLEGCGSQRPPCPKIKE